MGWHLRSDARSALYGLPAQIRPPSWEPGHAAVATMPLGAVAAMQLLAQHGRTTRVQPDEVTPVLAEVDPEIVGAVVMAAPLKSPSLPC